jgi:hypothetical protein
MARTLHCVLALLTLLLWLLYGRLFTDTYGVVLLCCVLSGWYL